MKYRHRQDNLTKRIQFLYNIENNRKVERTCVKKKMKKWEKILQKYEKKSSERSEKVHASIKRSKICLYQEK